MVGTATGPQLVGRSAERTALFAAWDRAAAGKSAAVLITGEAGIGKSRLAAELTGAVEAADGRVLIGACSALGEGALPYAPILEALHGAGGGSRLRLLDLVGARSPVGAGPVTDPMGQARVFAALLDRLERISARRPTLLVLEDLHWARASTLELVAYVARNRPRRLLPVLTLRTEGQAARLAALLAELTRLSGTERIDLRAMDLGQMTALLTGILEAPVNPRLAAQIQGRSGGNPFFAEELLAAKIRGEESVLPSRLQDILLARVHTLATPELGLLRAAAVLGHPADRTRLRRTARLPLRAFGPALTQLERRSLLVEDEGQGAAWRFGHDLMREAVYEAIPAAERRALHANAARAIATQRTPGLAGRDAEIAEHWQLADRAEMAIPHLALAGATALTLFAYEDAASWYQRAIEAIDLSGPVGGELAGRLADLLTCLAEALALSGDTVGAEAAGTRATNLLEAAADSTAAFLLRARRAHWLWLSGEEAAATRIWDQLRAEPVTPEMVASPQVLAVLARLTHLDRSATYAADAVASAKAAGLPGVEADALIWLGMSLAQTDHVDDGIAALRRSAALAAEQRNLDLYRFASHLLVAVLSEAERFSEAIDAGEEQLRVLDELRLEPRLREPILMNYRDNLAWVGRWDQVMSEVSGALKENLADDTRSSLLLLRASISLARGDAATASDDLERAVRFGRTRVQESHHGAVAILRAELALAEGRLEAAAAHVDDGLDAVEATGDLREDTFHDLVLLGLRIQAARAHRPGATRALVARPRQQGAGLLHRLRRRRAWRSPSYTLFVRQIETTFVQARAEGRRIAGRPAPELWGRAADGWAELQRPASEAYARMRLGEDLAAVGDPSAASVLTGARRIATGLGARRLTAEIDSAAAAAGVALGMAPGDAVDRYRLTRREREVLGLVTKGWSNKEIGVELGITEKTAEIHVSNTIHKLGVERRLEAAMVAIQQGLLAPVVAALLYQAADWGILSL